MPAFQFDRTKHEFYRKIAATPLTINHGDLKGLTNYLPDYGLIMFDDAAMEQVVGHVNGIIEQEIELRQGQGYGKLTPELSTLYCVRGDSIFMLVNTRLELEQRNGKLWVRVAGEIKLPVQGEKEEVRVVMRGSPLPFSFLFSNRGFTMVRDSRFIPSDYIDVDLFDDEEAFLQPAKMCPYTGGIVPSDEAALKDIHVTDARLKAPGVEGDCLELYRCCDDIVVLDSYQLVETMFKLKPALNLLA
jgi:hypothetical protein